jgi:hypothetical protein
MTCTDEFTEEVTKTNCADCFGTGFEFGYFDPLPAMYADIGLQQNREHRNPNVGMEKQDIVTARFIGDPQIYSYDVWCNNYSDERHYIHNITEKAHVRGVGLIFEAELRLAPFTDIIYTIPLDNAFDLKAGNPITKLPPQCKPTTKPSLNYLDAAFAELRERLNR